MVKAIKVLKRTGNRELIDYNKIHFVLEESVKNLSGVSVSDIVMNASLQFFDNIKTTDIQELLIKSANSLISEDSPNYEIVAARLINYNLRKNVFGDYITPSLMDIIVSNIDRGVYDPIVLEYYSAEEITKLNSHINHDRDDDFKSAGIQQCIDKYLLKDRVTGQIYETPQYAFMLIAMTLFSGYDRYSKKIRLKYVKDFYDAVSKFELNLPTPIICGARTLTRQYSSCVKIDIDDDMDSIIHCDGAIKKYTSQRAGIGINVGRIRGMGSKVKGGEVIHTGIVPFLKCFEASLRSCTQNGVRGGGGTVHAPFWHSEIETYIVLKNNKGNDENRARKLDYSVQLNRMFYKRVQENRDISLFHTNMVPGLFESMSNNDHFEALYEKYESQPSLVVSTVNARELFANLVKERIETGRIYIMNIDNCNDHSSFTDSIYMSNLCQEITIPTKPIRSYNDPDGEIALCTLMAINLGRISIDNLHRDMSRLMDLAVRALDEIIGNQSYPLLAAENSTKRRRTLGIGVIGLTHFLAKNKTVYGSPECLKLVHRTIESLQYHGLVASNALAKTDGACEWFSRTKYAQGIFPIDTYKPSVDKIITPTYELDWDTLRKDVKEFGLRNSAISAQMPSESSSVVSNETNGIEAPRSVIQWKKSKMGLLKMLVPEYRKYKDYYRMVWDESYSNTDYFNIAAIIQKFYDQAISVNEYYNPEFLPNGDIPVKQVMQTLMYGYITGMKNAYYLNVYDGKEDGNEDEDDTKSSDTPEDLGSDDSGCDSGACSI